MKEQLARRGVDIGLAIAAAVLLIVVLATSRSVTTGESLARERNVLAAFRKDELTRIVIERGTERVVLEVNREADAGLVGWRLAEPVEEPAGVFEMEELLNALDHATVVRRLPEDEVDRTRMGLTNPRAVLTLEMGVIHYRVVVGGEAVAPPGAAYIEVTGDGVPRRGVMIVRGETANQFVVGIDDLREPKLAPYLSDALARLRIEGVGGLRKLRPAGQGWRFDGMARDRLVDRRIASNLFLQLVGLSAEEQVPVQDARRLTAGAETVQVTQVPRGNGPRAVLVIGGQCPHDPEQVVVLRREPDPLGGCAPRDALTLFSTPAAQLVSRRLFSVEIDEVESLKIASPRQTFELVRKDSGFLLREPRELSVSYDAGSQRLLGLLEITGELLDEPDLRALGLDPPTTRVRISASGADDDVFEEEVLIGEPGADGSVAVLREADRAVLRVDRNAARALTPDTSLVRPLELFEFEVEDVRRVSMSGLVDQEIVRRADGSLSLERPQGTAVDSALAADLVATLVHLVAERWVADQDDGTLGFERPELVIHIDVANPGGEPLTRELVVGGPAPGGNYASLRGDHGVFILARRDRLAIEQLVIDRSVFLLDPQHTLRLRLRTENVDIELSRVGGLFEQSSGQPMLESEAIARLVDALGDLRPEGAVHLGRALPEEGFDRPQLIVSITPEAGYEGPVEMTFGAGDSWRGVSIHYARVKGVDATYAMARGLVRRILDTF